MFETVNPFFTSGYASAAIAKLFAVLPAPGTHPVSSSSAPAKPGSSSTARFASATAGNTGVPAANATEAAASGTGTAIEMKTASLTIVAPSPTIHDLAIEEMVLTGNKAGLVRPSAGSSKFVDALMQLATGSDMALAIAARNLLPRIAGNGEYDLTDRPSLLTGTIRCTKT